MKRWLTAASRSVTFVGYNLALAHTHNAQVYTLEKVLVLKKDPVTQVVFLDEAMKVGVNISAYVTSRSNSVLPRFSKIDPVAHFGLHLASH